MPLQAKLSADPVEPARVEFVLARALMASKRDRGRALTIAREAAEALRADRTAIRHRHRTSRRR